MREPVRCPHCKRWFPLKNALDTHIWRRHMTDEERKQVHEESKKKLKPMTDKDWADLQKGE